MELGAHHEMDLVLNGLIDQLTDCVVYRCMDIDQFKWDSTVPKKRENTPFELFYSLSMQSWERQFSYCSLNMVWFIWHDILLITRINSNRLSIPEQSQRCKRLSSYATSSNISCLWELARKKRAGVVGWYGRTSNKLWRCLNYNRGSASNKLGN